MNPPNLVGASGLRNLHRFVFSSKTYFQLLHGIGLPLTMLNINSGDYDLTVRQNPERARVAGGKEKGNSL